MYSMCCVFFSSQLLLSHTNCMPLWFSFHGIYVCYKVKSDLRFHFNYMGTPEIHLYTQNIGIKKITEIKMCDFFVFFNQILRKKIDQIQLTYGSVWLWTGAELVSISISLVMNLCMCFSFVKCKGHCSKDWTCLLQIYSLLLSIL